MKIIKLDGNWNTHGTQCQVCKRTFDEVFRLEDFSFEACGNCIDKLQRMKELMIEQELEELEWK